MTTKGERTREHILETAERLILQSGYSGTSIERIITESGITKGGFFYHFDGKIDLARNLIKRYLQQDEQFFAGLRERAVSLTEDPLQQLLIFLKLMAEALANLPAAHPGCLVASFTYESQQFDDEVRALNATGLLSWRRMFTEMLEAARAGSPAKAEPSTEVLADMLTSVIEGGIVMSRCLGDKNILPEQLLQYRNYIRLLFEH